MSLKEALFFQELRRVLESDPGKIMYNAPLPKRVRLLMLGGGIHGVGLLHDMASRGWSDVHLVEKNQIGAGTSSRSTKLIHGGLRYLRQIQDFNLVFEALHERALLKDLAPDLVRPLEMILPVLKSGGMPSFMLRSGLFLYDLLAGKAKIEKFQKLTASQVSDKAPALDMSKIKAAYSYWDMQTDDLALVRRAAASAVKLGGGITEHCTVKRISPSHDGWNVEVEDSKGQRHSISALYVFNATGPWANRLLESSDILPPYGGVNSKGAHIIVQDKGHKAGLFLQSVVDGRMFFVLPWLGHTLIGTTETNFGDDPDLLSVTREDIRYLCDHATYFLKQPVNETDVLASFAGLRWLPLAQGKKLGQISRSDVIGELSSDRGVMYTLYGGKLTTYRKLAQDLGDVITKHFGEFRRSKTMEKSSWVSPEEDKGRETDILQRFKQGGIVYTARPSP